MTAQRVAEATWVDVCGRDDVPVERGVAVLLDGVQLALFRTFDGALYAIGNRDPFSGANVLARGIVGTRGAVPVVVSPMLKQSFALTTGVCFDDPDVRVPVYEVRERDGRVQVLR
jgi:nitrite reductase (NADH) small subunit